MKAGSLPRDVRSASAARPRRCAEGGLPLPEHQRQVERLRRHDPCRLRACQFKRADSSHRLRSTFPFPPVDVSVSRSPRSNSPRSGGVTPGCGAGRTMGVLFATTPSVRFTGARGRGIIGLLTRAAATSRTPGSTCEILHGPATSSARPGARWVSVSSLKSTAFNSRSACVQPPPSHNSGPVSWWPCRSMPG